MCGASRTLMNNGANVCAQLYFRFERRQCIRRLYAVAHQARARRPRDCKLAWPRWPRSARGMAWRIMLPATLATSTQYPHMCSFSSSYGLERFSSARLVRGHIVRGWSCPPSPPPIPDARPRGVCGLRHATLATLSPDAPPLPVALCLPRPRLARQRRS